MKPIKFRAWDGNYEVGSDGSIWSINFNHTGRRGRLKTFYNKDGYECVFLMKGGRRKYQVHRMVAISFLDNPLGKETVNHINKDKKDNNITNLERATRKENVIHDWKTGRKHSDKNIIAMRDRFRNKNPKSKINKEIAKEIILEREGGLLLKDLSKKYGLSISQIGQICKGKYFNY